MRYKELLEMYKEGKLEESEKNSIEVDIEKQEAISEYLFEINEDNLFDKETSDNSLVNDNSDITKKINASIRKAFIKLGIVVGVAVLCISLFVLLGLPKLVSTFYYNPAEKQTCVNKLDNYQFEKTAFENDIAAFTELWVPNHYRTGAYVSYDKGYGSYDVMIPNNWGEKNEPTMFGTIVRNELSLSNQEILARKLGMTTYLEHDDSKYFDLKRKDIEVLNDNEYYDVKIRFKEILTYDEVIDFIKEYDGDDLRYIWAAPVMCYEKEEDGTSLTMGANEGFFISPGSYEVSDTYVEGYNLYPWGEDEYLSEEKAKEHYIDLLKYMESRTQFRRSKLKDDATGPYDTSYIEKNGLQIYGMYVKVSKDLLMKMRMDSSVWYLTMN